MTAAICKMIDCHCDAFNTQILSKAHFHFLEIYAITEFSVITVIFISL